MPTRSLVALLLVACVAGCDKATGPAPCDRLIASMMAALNDERYPEAHELYVQMTPECVLILRAHLLRGDSKVWAFAAGHPEIVDEDLFQRALERGEPAAVVGATLAFRASAATDWVGNLNLISENWHKYDVRSKTAILVHVRYERPPQWSSEEREALTSALIEAATSDDSNIQRQTFMLLGTAFDLAAAGVIDMSMSEETSITRAVNYLRQGHQAVEQLMQFPRS